MEPSLGQSSAEQEPSDERFDHSYCDDRLESPTLAFGGLALFGAIAAPVIYTANPVDLAALLCLLPAVGFAMWVYVERRHDVAPRQLLARFIIGWIAILPALWVVCGLFLLLFVNFIYAATLLPIVLAQLSELGLWIVSFAFLSLIEEFVKIKIEVDQHFEQLPALRVFILLGGATTFGLGTGTAYYLCFLSRYWLQGRCDDSNHSGATHTGAHNPACLIQFPEMLLIALICTLFAVGGQLLGWLHNAPSTWTMIAAQGRNKWNPRQITTILMRGCYSGTSVFAARLWGDFSVFIVIAMFLACAAFVRLSESRLRLEANRIADAP